MGHYHVYRSSSFNAEQVESINKFYVHNMIAEPFVDWVFGDGHDACLSVCPVAPIKNEEVDAAYELLLSYEQVNVQECVFFDLSDRTEVSDLVASGKVFKTSASVHNGAYGLHYPISPHWQLLVEDEFLPPITQTKYVVGFQGCIHTHFVRSSLKDTSDNCSRAGLHAYYSETATHYERNRFPEYARSIIDAKFVLCPRGGGLSSYRLYETLSAGRIPIIYSDDLVLPLQDKLIWSEFTIRIPERDMLLTPDYVREFMKTHDLSVASQKARTIWRRFFSRNGTGLKRLLDKELFVGVI